MLDVIQAYWWFWTHIKEFAIIYLIVMALCGGIIGAAVGKMLRGDG